MSDIRNKMLENMNRYKANKNTSKVKGKKSDKQDATQKDTHILFDSMLEGYEKAGLSKSDAINNILDEVIAVSMK